MENQHVYCTNCRHFKPLFEAIMKGVSENPEPCHRCFPYEVEDSRPRPERPYYEEETTQP